MKYENKLNDKASRDALYKSLVNWELNADGMNFAIGEVLEQIPWEVDEIETWEKWYNKIDEAIGSHKNWDIYLLLCDENYRQMFLKYIDNKLNDILKVYAMAIEDLNKKYKKCMVVEKFTHTDNYGYCRYEIVEKVYGDSYYDCICDIWEKYHMNHSDWSFQQFVDACYNSNVHMKDDLSCHFGDKATNSKV